MLALVPAGVASSGGGLPDDSYTPENYLQLFNQDTDLGSVSLAILPVPAAHVGQHLGVQLGKDAQIRLIDLTNMSGTNLVGSVGGEFQILPVSAGRLRHERAAGDMDRRRRRYVAADRESHRRVRPEAALLEPECAFPRGRVESRGERRSSAVVANDVLYYAAACSSSFCMTAADPVTGDVLWTSSEHLATLHWQSPILVNGAIYIADGTHLHRFDTGDIAADTVFQNGFDP